MRNLILTTYFSVWIMAMAFGQMVEKAEREIFLLKGGSVETLGEGLKKADVLIADGRIKEIHSDISHPGAQIINCSGLTLYPGLIDGGTRLGLSEISSLSLTQDHDERGKFTPHMQALTAVNPNSVVIPVTRVNGITTVLTVPTGGLFPGTAALINLHGYTPEQMYAGFKAVVMDFPSSGRRGSWDRRSDTEIETAEQKAMDELNEFWDNAVLHEKLSRENDASLEFNPQLKSMHKVVRAEMPLLIEVNREKDILKAIEWIKDKELKAVFTGVAEGFRVADSLSKYNIPVITGPVLRNPFRSSDRYDVAYTNAGVMHKAGVKVALRTNESSNVRNLPYNAAFAAAYGMDRVEALKAVTIIPAEIFGIDDDYGSIEQGKIANIFVTNGDPFETATEVKYLFINGWKIPLESRHTLLYDEFLDRQPGLNK